MLKKYSFYLLKSQKTILGIYSFICFFIFPLLVIVEGSSEYHDIAEMGLYIYAVILCIGTILVPLISYYFTYNKRSVDVYYSLPIKREHLFDIHYFIPLLCLYLPIIINYCLGVIVGYIKNSKLMNPSLILSSIGMMLCILVIMFAAYSIVTFFIQKCNSFIDAIIISISTFVLPFITFLSGFSLTSRFLVPTGVDQGNLLSWILKLFSPVYNAFTYIEALDYRPVLKELYFIIPYMLVISIVLYGLARTSFVKRKGEDASSVTKHILTYPFIINLMSLCIISFIDFFNIDSIESLIINLCIIFIVFIIMNFIARRKVIMNIWIIGKFLLYIGIVIIISLTARHTDCFGLNNQLVTIDYDKVEVDLYDYDLHFTYDRDDQAKIDELQNLQLIASQKYKEGTYDLDYENCININITYYTDDDAEYRYYLLEKDEIPQFLFE